MKACDGFIILDVGQLLTLLIQGAGGINLWESQLNSVFGFKVYFSLNELKQVALFSVSYLVNCMPTKIRLLSLVIEI